MAKSTGSDVARFTLSRARAVAEFAEWVFLLEQHDREIAEAPAGFAGDAHQAAVVVGLALASGWSEGQTRARIAAARTLRDRMPLAWVAFREGRIDAARALLLAETADKLRHESSVVRLDQNGTGYAVEHQVAELRRWAKRFVAQVEPVDEVEAAETARSDRRVEVWHDEHGMAWLNAYLPSHLAAAIAERLRVTAKSLSGDERTQPQRQADLLTDWLLSASEADETSLRTDIAVTIPASVLGGLTPGLAESYDGTWSVPVGWVLDLVESDTTFWHRMITDPLGRVLDHTYLGRFVPEILDKALEFRDQVCRGPGRVTPARTADKDHRTPWPLGETSADNLWSLSKSIHRMKGHGALVWQTAHGTYDADEPGTPSTDLSWAEHRLAQLIAAA